MKTLLLFLLTLPISTAIAQNWELFNAGETYNFNESDIHGVRVDSVKASQIDTVFYFNRILNDTVHYNFYFNITAPIQDITQPNIFGNKVISKNDSLIFKNQFNDTIYFTPKASLNISWDFITTDTSRIEATVDSIYSDSINQQLDSIKLFSFQCFDNLNNPINHPLNSKIIVLSKSNGIIKTFNFYETVARNSIYNSYKINYSRIFQNIFFSRGEVYDLNIGDEYHYNFHSTPPNSPPGHNIYNHKVINRVVSSNGDTITLTISEVKESKRSTLDYTTNPPTLVYSTTYSSRTFDRLILRPNEQLDSIIGFEPIITNVSNSQNPTKFASITSYSFYLPYSQHKYNNRISISPYNIAVYDSIFNSWLIAPSTYSKHSLVGVFSFTNYWNNQGGGGGYPEYHSLIYFKKGTETWGTPRIVTGIDEQAATEKEQDFTIYPNPASNKVFIKSSFEKLNYTLNSLDGSLIDQGQLRKNYSIDVFSFPNGVYFLRLESENAYKVKKLIINR